MKPTNTAKRTLLIWLAVGLLGGLAVALPFITDIDIANGGGALIMVGLVFFFTGPIVALMYWHRSRVFDELYNPQKTIVNWRYNTQEWKRFAQDEYEYRRGSNWGLFIMVVVISLIVGGIFWLADPKTGPIIMTVMVGLIILIGIVAWLATKSYSSWADAADVEARIGFHGLLLNKQLHVWVGWGARLEEAKIDHGKLNLIIITYSTPNRYSRQFFTIRVPIPDGQEKQAEDVINKLS